jgi:hypothetical protein
MRFDPSIRGFLCAALMALAAFPGCGPGDVRFDARPVSTELAPDAALPRAPDAAPSHAPDAAPPPAPVVARVEDVAWAQNAFAVYVLDPCAGILVLRDGWRRLTPPLLRAIAPDWKAEREAEDAWAVARGKLIGGGGPDVGAHPRSSLPMFAAIAGFIAANRGDPAYPEAFRAQALAIIRGSIGVEELFAAMELSPYMAPLVPGQRAQRGKYRAEFEQYGMDPAQVDDELRRTWLPSLRGDACLALPHAQIRPLLGN